MGSTHARSEGNKVLRYLESASVRRYQLLPKDMSDAQSVDSINEQRSNEILERPGVRYQLIAVVSGHFSTICTFVNLYSASIVRSISLRQTLIGQHEETKRSMH